MLLQCACFHICLMKNWWQRLFYYMKPWIFSKSKWISLYYHIKSIIPPVCVSRIQQFVTGDKRQTWEFLFLFQKPIDHVVKAFLPTCWKIWFGKIIYFFQITHRSQNPNFGFRFKNKNSNWLKKVTLQFGGQYGVFSGIYAWPHMFYHILHA